MRFVQIGPPTGQVGTSYESVTTDASLPYQSVWWANQSPAMAGVVRFIPDLSVHLVFDLSGLLDPEPFLIQTGLTYVDLDLPAGVQLLGMQFAVWEALRLREGANEQPAIYSICFDFDWAHLLYFTLLDARNGGATSENALQLLAEFKRWIDSSLRKDFNKHFLQVSAQPELSQPMAYSERHQRRLYHELTGTSPVQFNRIVRFQKALQRIRAERSLSWDEYYDQAHFSREFKECTGLTPAYFLKHYCG